MLVTNVTSNYYYLGDGQYPLPPGGATTVPDQTYNDNDAIAKSIHGLDDANAVTVSSAPSDYPRTIATSGGGSGLSEDDVQDLIDASISGATDLATDTEVTTELGAQRRAAVVVVSDPNGSALTTGDGKAYFVVPALMNGHNLVAVLAAVTTVSSSGIPTVQVRNVTQAADMLTTKLTVDANEASSATAATAAVIDTANDDVATGDILAIDVDVAGTGTKGLMVVLTFEAP